MAAPDVLDKKDSATGTGNIDVLQHQMHRAELVPVLNYHLSDDHFVVVRFIFECGIKLEAQPMTTAVAAVFYHKFFRNTDSTDYDRYLIAVTALYLAGKAEEDHLKLRDVINVSHSVLHRGAPVLDLNDKYWSTRDSIVQAELLMLRMIQFQVSVPSPHRYMLHYLKSLEEWIGADVTDCVRVSSTCMAFLQDFHHNSIILDYKAQHIALAVINLTLQCYGLQIPFTSEVGELTWYSVLCSDMTKDTLWELMEKIMGLYDKESSLYPSLLYHAAE